MQQGIISWNKGSLELENGSKISSNSTSSSAVRGGSYNVIFLDEFAFIPNHIADDFFASVYPTISSGQSTKVIIVSTPRGMNHFYRMWHDAERGKNEYVPTDVHWSEVPGRDEKWKASTIANTSEQQFKVEFECEFLGSVDTLIAPSKLRSLVYDHPKTRSAGLDVYDIEPLPENHKLRFLPNALLLPHLGYVTKENYEVFYKQMAQNLLAFKEGKPIRVIQMLN